MTLPHGFIAGADVSSVIALERSGVVFRDETGRPADLFELLAGARFTDVRVRVWNAPFDADGRGYGGGTVDVDRAIEIGRRATAAGLRVLVDFHYSDFWADPGKQLAPKVWRGLGIDDKVAALGLFTRDALTRFRDARVDVRMVQVGNETNGALAGETEWPAIIRLLEAGAAGVRATLPDALVAVHFADPQTPGRYAEYVDILTAADLDYDVFASSYYPIWHGTLEHLAAVLRDVIARTGRRVAVVETAWPFTVEDGDGQPNMVVPADIATPYPVSVEGQAAAIEDVTRTVADLGPAALGVYYWEPAWLPVGPPERLDENRRMWEEHGSGWATSAAGEYLADAAERHGGSEWENQALFAYDGTPHESFRVFERMGSRTG